MKIKTFAENYWHGPLYVRVSVKGYYFTASFWLLGFIPVWFHKEPW